MEVERRESGSSSQEPEEEIFNEHIPSLALEFVFKYFDFHQIAIMRAVCRKFNDVGQRSLSDGFSFLKRYHRKCDEQIERMLSESKEVGCKSIACLEIYQSFLFKIDARICLLDLTYLIYINANRFCFIPGKVIDEILQVLRQIYGFKKEHREFNWNNQNPLLYKFKKEQKEIEEKMELQRIKKISDKAIKHFLSNFLPKYEYPMSHFYLTRPDSSSVNYSMAVVDAFGGTITYEALRFEEQNRMRFRADQNHINELREQLQSIKNWKSSGEETLTFKSL